MTENEKTINEKFKSVIQEKTGLLPIAKQVELVLPQIEEAKAMGFTYPQIVDLLAVIGIPVNLKKLQNVLYLLRRREKKALANKSKSLVRKEKTTTATTAVVPVLPATPPAPAPAIQKAAPIGDTATPAPARKTPPTEIRIRNDRDESELF